MTDPLDGREVITREPAYLTTAFGKELPEPKEVKGICRALLSDGSTVYLCEQGDYAKETLQPVIRHLAKHAPSSRKYTAEAQATILRYREMEHARSRQGWAERVAARLNKEDKIKRNDDKPWLAHHVASLTRHWLLDPGDHDPMAALPVPPITNRERALTIATNLAQARKLLDEIADMEAVFSGCDHDDYDELKAKAAMLDQMRSFMGEGK